MKILYLCPDLGIPVLGHKGASVHVREMVSAFHRNNHKVILAAQTLNKSPWEKPAELDVPILHVRSSAPASVAVTALKTFNETLGLENSLPGELRRLLYNKELEVELKRRLENDPPDFVYERASLYATAGVTLARHYKVPLLLEVNAPLALEQSTYRSTGFGELAAHAERWTLSQADAVLAVSSPLREHLISLGAASAKTHVFPNGVNTELFSPAPPDMELRRRLGIGEGPVIGFVGGLRPWHGVAVLPALLETLRKAFPTLQVVIAGEGPLRQELQRDFFARNLSQHVTFIGSVPHQEVAPIIGLFDVAVAPYTTPEHNFYFSPLKIFEYMACGKSIVAARLGQIADVVSHCETGFLYEPGNIEDLASSCANLLNDAQLRDRIGGSAARHVRSTYTWEHNAVRAVDLARNLISQRK